MINHRDHSDNPRSNHLRTLRSKVCLQHYLLFRCGYHPDQYPSEREWGARLMMERSIAIKSPSIHYHLAGTKKVRHQRMMTFAGNIS